MQVWLILGVRENRMTADTDQQNSLSVIQGIGKDFFHSYREPSLVPHAEKVRQFGYRTKLSISQWRRWLGEINPGNSANSRCIFGTNRAYCSN